MHHWIKDIANSQTGILATLYITGLLILFFITAILVDKIRLLIWNKLFAPNFT